MKKITLLQKARHALLTAMQAILLIPCAPFILCAFLIDLAKD